MSLKLFFQKLFLVSLLFAGCSINVNAQVISTYAGTGVAGYNGTGGAAQLAKIHSPLGLAVDHTGILYIGDWANNIIRKVSTSGVITNMAGIDTIGFRGDGGPATNALLNHPMALFLDNGGSLYFSDEYNYRVRRISPSGIITTVAGNGSPGYNGDGGQATAASLAVPWGIVKDAAGNLFIAERDNKRIRKVTTSGIISTIAGTGIAGYSGDGGAATAAMLGGPAGMAIDAIGNIYFADLINNTIRKITPSGIISTIAGNGSIGYSGDGGPATAAKLHSPNAVSLDAAGNIYIGDAGNSRVRKIDNAGIITTTAGSGTAGYSGDGGPATAAELQFCSHAVVAASGKIFIADQGNSVIRCIGCPYVPANVTVLENSIKGIQVFPNPAIDKCFSLTVYTLRITVVKLRILNLLGVTVYEDECLSNTRINIELNVPQGIYMLFAYTDSGIFTERIIMN